MKPVSQGMSEGYRRGNEDVGDLQKQQCPPLQHNHVKLNTQKDVLCYWLTQGGRGEKIVKER